MTRAVDRLRDEMAARHDDAALCALGELLTAALAGNPALAAAVLDEKKTLAGAYQALEDFARKLPRKGPSVCVTDAAALKVALKYYGADAGNREQGTGDRGQGTGDRGQGTGNRGQGTGDPVGAALRRPPVPPAAPAPFAPSLDDLLEGL